MLIFSLLFLEGCWGKKEVEELAFVIGIGIDKGSEEGKYLLTYQIAMPKKSGESGAEMEDWTLSVEVGGLPTGKEKVFQILNKSPFIGTSRVIIFGEELARDGISDVIDLFQRVYEYRRTVFLLQAKGKAKDILETKLRTKQLPAISLLGTIQGAKDISSFPVTRIGHYLTLVGQDGRAPLIPVVSSVESNEAGIEYKDSKGKEIRIAGAAVFRDGKLIGYLTEEETKGFLWLENEVGTRYVYAAQDDISVVAWVTKSSTKYDLTKIGGKVGIHYKIRPLVTINEIRGVQKQMDIQEWNQFVKTLEPVIAQAIEKECQAALEKERAMKKDFLGIGRHIEQKDIQYWKQVKADWEEMLPDIPVSFDIQVTIENAGLSRNTPVSPW